MIFFALIGIALIVMAVANEDYNQAVMIPFGLVFIMTAILPNFAGLPLLLDLTPGKMRRLD